MRIKNFSRNKRFDFRYRQGVREFLVALCLFWLFFVLSGCATMGQASRQADAGFESMAPIVLCLERFHKDNQRYPNSLTELIPDYIPRVPKKVDGLPVIYKPQDKNENFTLSFQFRDPKLNYCTYSSMKKSWDCQAYF